MKTAEGRFSGAGGVEIFWQAWIPEPEVKAAVVLAHGASEHSGRYAHVGTRLAREGYAVYALDHRGHGRSEGKRAVIDRAENAFADIDQLVSLAREAQPGVKVFLLGHSMGGCLSLGYALDHQDRLDGLLLSGPVAALEAASPATLLIGRALSAVAPGLGIFAIDSDAVSRDPKVVEDYDADPLNHHGKLPARTVAEMAGQVARFPDGVGALTLPLLIQHGSEDRLAPVGGSQMVHDNAGSADKQLEIYDGLYHEILNEPERDKVMDDMVAWLDKHA